ncbi:MAG: YraN family protein [Gammaproteobacteria bacterium]
MLSLTQNTGHWAEELASRFLEQRGLRLLNRNYQCRYGEIDLIMEHDDALVFVEVRYREGTRCGSSAESIDARKRERLLKTAQHYLRTSTKDQPCRFDAVLIEGLKAQPRIEWVTGAF